MKKSELFTLAMEAVLEVGYPKKSTLAILEVLMEERKLAEYNEQNCAKGEKNDVEQNTVEEDCF